MSVRARFGAALACAAALWAPLSAEAQVNGTNVWTNCDGYGKATKAGDGMTEYAIVLLMFSPPGYGTTGKIDPVYGRQAVTSCDTALDGLPKDQWRRRVSLLRARALHRLEALQTTDVLEDLDQAAAVGQPGASDVLFQRSQGLGVDLVRVFALRRLGRTDDAKARGALLVEARPYDRGSLSSTSIALGDAIGDADAEKLDLAMARLVPGMRVVTFQAAFDEGRFDQVLELYPYLQGAPHEGVKSVFPLETMGMRAYALAALGRSAEARAILAPARSATLTKAGDMVVARWTQAVERRIMVSEGRAAQVIATLDAAPLVGDGSGVDTLLALAKTLPDKDAAAPRQAALDLRGKLRGGRRSASGDQDTVELFRHLPEAETTGRLPPWREAKKPMLAMKGSQADTTALGYRETVAPDGLVTVRYRGGNSSGGSVEEMALLRAAYLARQAGKKGFVVVGRRDTAWTVDTTYYGTTIRKDPGGFETEIDVRFDDPPADGAALWVGLEADVVYAALAPIYIPAAPAAVRASR
jgi:hypothetical protein